MAAALRNRKNKPTSEAQSNDTTEDQTGNWSNGQNDAEESFSRHPVSTIDPSSPSSSYRLTPLIQRGLLQRLDVGPFAVLYFAFVVADHVLATDQEKLSSSSFDASTIHNLQTLTTVGFCLALLFHASLVFGTQWSIRWKVFVGYARAHVATEPEKQQQAMLRWTHCFVESLHSAASSASSSSSSTTTTSSSAAIGGSNSGIAPIQFSDDQKHAIVNFEDHIFRYCPSLCWPDGDVKLWDTTGSNTNSDETTTANKAPAARSTAPPQAQFRPLFYPVDLPLEFYASWKGHSSVANMTLASNVYGLNQTVVQLPSFGELLSEQLIAPFFLFQVFCVVLWSLDEYWYYAIFTLCALIMFESTLAYNRQQSLLRLHQAGNTNAGQRIWVRRRSPHLATSANFSSSAAKATWMLLPKTELVPGDHVSVSATSADGTPVPADILLLQGSAVCDEALLTGESVPQLKQALDTSNSTAEGNSSGATRLDLQDNQHKESVLFGGTKLLVANVDETSLVNMEDMPPDQGITGMVLRTGFETVQGNLLRTMAHSARSADGGIHTWDTFVFILLLLLCAFGAAAVVLQQGWNDVRRNRFRLVLHVIIIITSVVPPELPMELSLAITNSMAALVQRCKVYCSELFRIPWAGEVNVCCFDKTGTLTSDEMRLRGVRLPTTSGDSDKKGEGDSDENKRISAAQEEATLKLPNTEDGSNNDIPQDTLRVMIGCHSLTSTGSFVVGDPLEQAVLKTTGYRLFGNGVVAPIINSSTVGDKKTAMTILHRFAFSSKLKRMTVLVTEEGARGQLWALTKGAPETIKPLLTSKSVPFDYDQVAFHHMSLGRRVLAMACRSVGTVSSNLKRIKDKGRVTVESNLTFVGFLILDCPLKSDSKLVVSELRKTGHNTVMITGDAILTAVEVARQVSIIPSTNAASSHVVYRIQPAISSNNNNKQETAADEFECVNVAGDASTEKPLPVSRGHIPGLRAMQEKGDTSFSITGDVLIRMAQAMRGMKPGSSSLSTNDEKAFLLHPTTQEFLGELVPLISVFARHAPHQKEAVVAAFNHGGYRTLMVGDGTNDVGALKRAHVGISIISAPEVESKHRDASNALSKMKGKKSDKGKKRGGSQQQQRQLLEQLREAQEELDRVELGDASVAAPFTSRAVSIKCVKDVIQQGRCTLVTMLQIYKILGINCLVNAMVLSNLFLFGVKQGDRQLTILGMAVAALFYFVTRAEPLPTLSTTRPPSSVMCSQALVSIVLQFGVHMGAIAAATHAALVFVDPYDPSLVPDGPFNPNVLNSCTFMLTCVATVNTFAINYRGQPFMQELRKNKLMYRSLQVCYGVLTICALEVFPPLNDLMQLTTLPDVQDRTVFGEADMAWLVDMLEMTGFPLFIFGLMVLDTVLAFVVERFARHFF